MRPLTLTTICSPRQWCLLGAFAASGLAGCTTQHDVASVGSEPESLVRLELTYSRELALSSPTRLEAEAHFVRYRAADPSLGKAAVADLLGVRGDEDLAAGSCRADQAAPVAGTGALEVALLDAGTLTIRNGGIVDAVVEPQHYPELLPFVSGVVYGIEVAPSREIAPAARIEIEANGGEDIGPFVASTVMPRAFPNLSVHLGSGIDLTWGAGESASAVSIELRWAGAHPGVVHCRANDDGRFTIPVSLTEGLDTAIATGATAQVSVARSERAALDAPGAGHGQVLVRLRDIAPLTSGQ